MVRYGTHKENVSGRPEQKYFSSDQRLGWPAEGHYLSLHGFVTFILPVPTYKNFNITLLPRNSERDVETSQKDFVGVTSKFQMLFLDL